MKDDHDHKLFTGSLDGIILANKRRVESVKDILKNCDTLLMPEQLKEDICALIAAVEEYTMFLEDIYDDIPSETDYIN